MRLFLAVELSESLRQQVERVQSLLRPAAANVRWVDPAGAHFTVKFLGDVGRGDLPAVAQATAPAAAAVEPTSVRVAGLGTFPDNDGRPPRVLWAGIHGQLDPVLALHADLDERLAPRGFAREDRPYRPHVTLGRVKGRRNVAALRQLVATHRDAELGSMRVHELVLLRSHPRADGAHYERLQTFPLGDRG